MFIERQVDKFKIFWDSKSVQSTSQSMISQLLFTLNVVIISFALSEAASNKRTNCTVEDNTVEEEIQKFYCTAVKVYDELETVSI